jgi:hypothetical protein
VEGLGLGKMEKKYKPRIILLTDFLPKEDWQIVDKYCRDNKEKFPYVGYGSPVRWKIEEHSKNSDIKYIRSFLISEEEYDLYMKGEIPEPYPDDTKHGDNYVMSVEEVQKVEEEPPVTALMHYSKWPNSALQNKTFDAISSYLSGVVSIVKEIYDEDCFSESGPWIAVAREGGYMNMHCDGTFIQNRDAITQYSSVYYINDDYEGGEFNMPLMGFKLKPKANSLLIFTHSSHEDMAHEVTPVISGDRFVSQGFFAVTKKNK